MQIPDNAQLLELGSQPSIPNTIEGSSDVQDNHEEGTTSVYGVVPEFREKDIGSGAAFPESKLSRVL